MSELATHPASVPRIAAHALGNVLLGLALGLLSYYAATNAVSVVEQRTLKSSAPPQLYETRVVPVVPSADATGVVLDFEGWAEEDKAYWDSLGEGDAFGRLVAEPMGLDSVVVKGTSHADLRKGPGWITYTDVPGPTGNCGISGHRTTYRAPFRQLDRMKPGDTIVFYSPYRRYTYRVRKTFAVTPEKVEVVASTEEPMLTLTACHPPYSARLRLIVQSDLVEVRQLATTAPPEVP